MTIDLTAITITIIGSATATGITFLYNWMARRRQEYVEMARFRMNKIGKAEKSYLDLIRYSSVLQRLLKDFDPSPKRLMDKRSFYYLISLIKAMKKLTDDVGGFLLINHDAEKAIINLHINIVNLIRDKLFTDLEVGELRESFLDSFTLLDLNNKLLYDKRVRLLFHRWKKWLKNKDNSEDVSQLRKSLLCYYDLLTLELNTVYKLWYESELNFFERRFHYRTIEARNYLNKETKDYLRKEKLFDGQYLNMKFPAYYRKLFSGYV